MKAVPAFAPALALALALAGCACASRPDGPPGALGRARLPVRGLSADETWRGEVRVRGSVVVPRGITLTVLPGTVVRFERLDLDGDGIGDSELYVEGRIVAEGTPDAPIRFTSAEADPAPRDWKYLFIERSDRSSLRHCVSEYAFSGVQIHFSKASVRRCTFRNNVDGLRFSTADGRFEGNRMTANAHGVRYEERGSRAELVGNEIVGNQVGIFCVTEGRGLATIRGNRIHGNERYDFKLGDRQKGDVPAAGNWWGTADPASIRDRIFDGASDPDLGRVLFEPPLPGPPDAGEGYGA